MSCKSPCAGSTHLHGRVYKTRECPVFVRLNLQEYSYFNSWLAMFTTIMYTHYLLQTHKQCTKLVPLSCSSSLHNHPLWENAVHNHNHKHNHRHHSSLHNHLHNNICITTILVPKWYGYSCMCGEEIDMLRSPCKLHNQIFNSHVFVKVDPHVALTFHFSSCLWGTLATLSTALEYFRSTWIFLKQVLKLLQGRKHLSMTTTWPTLCNLLTTF